MLRRFLFWGALLLLPARTFAVHEVDFDELQCVGGPEEIQECVTEKAIAENDPYWCEAIEGYLANVVIEKKSYGPIYSAIARCEKDVAVSKNNVEFCAFLAHKDTQRAHCVGEIAFQTRDYQKCELFEDDELINACFNHLRQLTDDIEICYSMISFRNSEDINPRVSQESCVLSFPMEREGFLDELGFFLIFVLAVLGTFLFVKASQRQEWQAIAFYLIHPSLLVILYFVLSFFPLTPLLGLFNSTLVLMFVLNLGLWPLALLRRSVKWSAINQNRSNDLFALFSGLIFVPAIFIILDNFIGPFWTFWDQFLSRPIFFESFKFLLFLTVILFPIVLPFFMLLFYWVKLRKDKGNLRNKLGFTLLAWMVLVFIYLWSFYHFIAHNIGT